MSVTNGTGGEDLEIPFIFVPRGAPEPTEWMAAHPGWVKFPATLVPREERQEPAYEVAQIAPAVVAAAEAGPLLSGVLGAAELRVAAGLGAALGAAAAFAGYLWPSQKAGPKYYGRRSSGVGNAPTEGFSASPPQPPAPGLVPPDVPAVKAGKEEFSTTPQMPSQPGSVPMPPLPHVLPGTDAQPQGAVIHEQNRNDGLAGGLRSDPRRARDAAREADPAVTQVLKDGEWQAHHLINVRNIQKYRDIFDAAAKAGWQTDEVGNVMPLPATLGAQQKLKERGVDRPTHRGGHPSWNKEISQGLYRIEKDLNVSGLPNNSDAYNSEARRRLRELEDLLRREMLQKSKIGLLPVDKGRSYA